MYAHIYEYELIIEHDNRVVDYDLKKWRMSQNSTYLEFLVLKTSDSKSELTHYADMIKALDENNPNEDRINLISRIIAKINIQFDSKTFAGDGIKRTNELGDTAINFPIEPLIIPESKIGSGIDDCIDIFFEKSIVDVVNSALSQTIVGRKAEYGDIAVLCRRNFDLDRIAEILKKAGFPVEVVGGKGFYKAKEIVDTYKLFNAVINNDSKYRSELIFTDYFHAIKSNALGMEFDDFILELEVVFRRETVEEILTHIFDKSCILEFYRANQNYQAISNLHKLKDISRNLMNKENMQPLQFLEYLFIMISTRQEEDDADITESERKNGVIRLYSVHKAKGLAFPIVILPCLDNKLNRPITRPKIILDIKAEPPMLAFDNRSIGNELPLDKDYASLVTEKITEHLAEEVRIFYVACTRAKHKLIFSCNRPISYSAKALQWENFASVSKWLCEIDNGKFIGQYRRL